MIINFLFLFFGLSVLGIVKSWDLALTAGDEVVFYENGTRINAHKGDFKELVGLTYDAFHKKLFLIDYNRNNAASVYSLSLRNRDVELITTQKGFIHSTAYDPNTDQLFWTNIKTKGIYFKSLSSLERLRMVFIDFDSNETPVGLAIDSCRGYVYWTNWGIKFSIQRARIDGLNREIVNDDDLHYPNALAIDQRSRKLFWVDTTEDDHYYISTADLNGENKIILLSGYKNIPIDMSVSLRYIFWVDESATHVWKVKKYEDQVPHVYKEISKGNAIFAHYTIEEQTKGVAECLGVRELYKNITLEAEKQRKSKLHSLQLSRLEKLRRGDRKPDDELTVEEKRNIFEKQKSQLKKQLTKKLGSIQIHTEEPYEASSWEQPAQRRKVQAQSKSNSGDKLKYFTVLNLLIFIVTFKEYLPT